MMSLKKVDGVGTLDGASVALGCEELFAQVFEIHLAGIRVSFSLLKQFAMVRS